MARPLHAPPARGADDLLRPGAGSARAGAARRAGRRPARRRQASARRRQPARRRTPMRWRCIWRSLVKRCADDRTRRICTWRTIREHALVASTFRAASDPDDLGLRRGESASRTRAGSFDETRSTGSRRSCDVTSRLRSAVSRDAARRAQRRRSSVDKVVSTDPPYYDNIGYADLSDFFYVWLRRSLQAGLPGPLRHARRAEGRGTGRDAVPPRRQGEGGGVLPRRHDAGDAPARRAGAPGLSGHHLLRLQAVRER